MLADNPQPSPTQDEFEVRFTTSGVHDYADGEYSGRQSYARTSFEKVQNPEELEARLSRFGQFIVDTAFTDRTDDTTDGGYDSHHPTQVHITVNSRWPDRNFVRDHNVRVKKEDLPDGWVPGVMARVEREKSRRHFRGNLAATIEFDRHRLAEK